MKGKFFKCESGSEALYVDYDEDCGVELAMFVHSPQNRSLRNRLRLAWAALRGKPYADMMLLSDENVADLVDYLIEIQSKQQPDKQ